MTENDLKQAYEKAAREHEPIGRIEFEHDEKRFVYDFDILTLEQRESARSIYQWGIEQAAKPPESLAKLFISGGHNIMLKAFGYLLRRIGPDGKPAKFDVEAAQGEVLEFVRDMPAAEMQDRLLECQADFFTRARIADLELIRLVRGFEAAREGIKGSLDAMYKAVLQLSQDTLEAADSTDRAKEEDEPEKKAETASSSGRSRKTTRHASRRRGK